MILRGLKCFEADVHLALPIEDQEIRNPYRKIAPWLASSKKSFRFSLIAKTECLDMIKDQTLMLPCHRKPKSNASRSF